MNMNDAASSLLHGSENDPVVIDRPSGLRLILSGFNSALLHVRTELEFHFGWLWELHQLDRNTTGLMVFACNVELNKDLNIQFDSSEDSSPPRCSLNWVGPITQFIDTKS